MEAIRRSISSLSLAEPHTETPAQILLKSHPQKSGWLRYRNKSMALLNNFNFFNRYLNRFFKWPNRFVVLTTETIHIYKTEYQNETVRSLNMIDVQRVCLYSDTQRYNCCIELVPKKAENLQLILAAPSKIIQKEWLMKIKENQKKYNDEQNGDCDDAENMYHELEPDDTYANIDLSEEDFLKSVITYHGTREQLVDLFETCAMSGYYVIRRSRKESKAVLSVFNGSILNEFLIMRNEKDNRVTLNMKVLFNDIDELLEYYESCSLPKTKDLKLTEPFKMFTPINT